MQEALAHQQDEEGGRPQADQVGQEGQDGEEEGAATGDARRSEEAGLGDDEDDFKALPSGGEETRWAS